MADEPSAEKNAVHKLHIWQIQAVRDVLLVAAVLGIFWLGYALRAVTVPLLIALALAYLFEPLVAKLSAHPKRSRAWVVGGLLCTVGTVAVLLLAALITLATTQTLDFIEAYKNNEFERVALKLRPNIPETFQPQYDRFADYLGPGDLMPHHDSEPAEESAEQSADPAGNTSDTESDEADKEEDAAARSEPADATPSAGDNLTEDHIRLIVDERLRELQIEATAAAAAASADNPQTPGGWVDFIRRWIHGVLAVIGSIVGVALLAFLIPFYFFFFSVWFPDIVDFAKSQIPDKNKDRTLDLIARMDAVIAGFVRGRIVISLLMGVMLVIGWKLCGVPYSVVVGMSIGILCAVPYLGGVGIPLAVALLAFAKLANPEAVTMAWWGVFLWPSLVFGIVQLVEGYVLTPMIAGKATNLDPVTILVAVLAGGSVMGIYGMLLAIPLVACLKILIIEVLMPHIQAWKRGEASDPLPIDSE